MSLETFCDLVWTEIWDDCPPMGDQPQYRRVMRELFLDGKQPNEVYWTDSKGKRRPLGDARGSAAPPDNAAEMLAELQAQARAAAEARRAENQ